MLVDEASCDWISFPSPRFFETPFFHEDTLDGVLRIPSAETCTGIATDALASLGTQVYEIYIPANITVIQEGAFNGLTELYYIEIHPDNPVYTSKEGLLYEK